VGGWQTPRERFEAPSVLRCTERRRPRRHAPLHREAASAPPCSAARRGGVHAAMLHEGAPDAVRAPRERFEAPSVLRCLGVPLHGEACSAQLHEEASTPPCSAARRGGVHAAMLRCTERRRPRRAPLHGEEASTPPCSMKAPPTLSALRASAEVHATPLRASCAAPPHAVNINMIKMYSIIIVIQVARLHHTSRSSCATAPRCDSTTRKFTQVYSSRSGASSWT
jgi:hypothetical protein